MAVRPAVAAADAGQLTVWYDGDCPICTAEIGLMRRLDRASAIEFVDLSLPDACPSDRNARLARLHAQPRGGPMITGHASHQIGLDADIWMTPMPARTLSRTEREEMSSTDVVRTDQLDVDYKSWTPAHMAMIRAVARSPEVQRIFVNPAIK